jgi:hypothetical protein
MFSCGRTLAGALALCALSICAFAVASASAAELTAVTCKAVGGVNGNYNNSHCETPKVAGEYDTVPLPLNETTEVTGQTAAGSEPALRATIAGAKITIKCSSTEIVGAIGGNTEPSPGKHLISGNATRTTFFNCHAYIKENEARHCVVVGTTEPGGEGMISTRAIKGTSTGVEHKGRVEPAEGTEFAKFTIKKAGTNAATEKECFFGSDVAVSVTGSVEGEANTTKHSHGTFTEANNGTGLKANGATANYLNTLVGVMVGTDSTIAAETFT